MEYTYRADGLRHSKATVTGTTVHLWDGQNIVADMQNGTVTNRYMRGVNLLYGYEGTTKQFYLYNGHGDVVQLTGTTGTVSRTYDYDAFGNQRDLAGYNPANDANPFRYCGEYFDRETGTVYLRARNYNPVNGRFTQEDPIRDGLNWYAYAYSNPVLYTDPTGLKPPAQEKTYAYIFYNPSEISGDYKHTFEDEAQIVKGQLERAGQIVILVPIVSTEDFKNAWDNMGNVEGEQVKIGSVYIIAHGGAAGPTTDGVGYMWFSSTGYVFAKETEAMSGNDIAVSDLASKAFQSLTFSTCNSGNPDIFSLADAFIVSQNITNYVVAWDGGTAFSYKRRQLIATGPNNQATYEHFAPRDVDGNITRERTGRVVYYAPQIKAIQDRYSK